MAGYEPWEQARGAEIIAKFLQFRACGGQSANVDQLPLKLCTLDAIERQHWRD